MNNYISFDENGQPCIKHSLFVPMYYRRIKQTNGKYRYFYSEREYNNYLNKDKRPKNRMEVSEQAERDKLAKQRYLDAIKAAEKEKKDKILQNRKKAIGDSRSIAYEQKQQKQNDQQHVKLNKEKEMPESVSIKDYLFGGQYAKNLKSTKKQLKVTAKEIENDKKKSEKLLTRIKALESKESLSEREKKRLSEFTSQNEELLKRINENTIKQIKQRSDFAIALYQYQGATLVGNIQKSINSVGSKVDNIIKKYKNKTLKMINSPSINIKRK